MDEESLLQNENTLLKASKLPNIIVITGPTACGKSRLAIELAQRLDAEIVNADSVQVYRDFNIGSSKPEAAELEKIPHHLFSVLLPFQRCSAGMFIEMAQQKLSELHQRGVLPIVVGGTGLYLRSLLCGLAPVALAKSESENVVAGKEAQFLALAGDKTEAVMNMHRWLENIDPLTAQNICRTDLQRIKRALVVRLSTGKSLAELQEKHKHLEYRYRALVLLMLPERQVLYRKIEERVDLMLSRGLVEEVVALRKMYPLNSHPFGAIGYRHISQMLDSESNEHDNWQITRREIQRDTRRYAKRQLTWWRNQPAKLGWETIAEPVNIGEQGNTKQIISDSLLGLVKGFLEGTAALGDTPVYLLPLRL